MVAPMAQHVFACTIKGLGVVALLLGGVLNSLSAAGFVSSARFAIVLLSTAVCLWIGFRKERGFKLEIDVFNFNKIKFIRGNYTHG